MNAPPTCPRAHCDAEIDLASDVGLEDGRWLWVCRAGHHGPRRTALEPYAR